MADKLTFDFDAVTSRMLIEFKERTGSSLMAVADDKGDFDLRSMDEKLIAGFIWLALRMSGKPDATWDDALDTPFTSLEFSREEPDPTSAGNES